jgi:hypothetical protein
LIELKLVLRLVLRLEQHVGLRLLQRTTRERTTTGNAGVEYTALSVFRLSSIYLHL